jgi:hypothetical protein
MIARRPVTSIGCKDLHTRGTSAGDRDDRTDSGPAAIKAWKTAASARYLYTSDPFAVEQETAGTSSSPGIGGAVSLSAKALSCHGLCSLSYGLAHVGRVTFTA